MSGLNYDDGLVTITHILKNGQHHVETLHISELERFEYRRPGFRRGSLTFITKDGRRIEGIEVERKYSAIFDELVDTIQRDIAGLTVAESKPNGKQGWSKQSRRESQDSLLQDLTIEVPFDGRHETRNLEFLGSPDGFSNVVPRIILDEPEFVVIDFETTGLHPADGDRIIQLAAVVVDKEGKILRDWSTFVNPDRDTGAVHIHGIKAHDVDSAPRFEQAWTDLSQILSGRIIVAHNSSFETRFLISELQISGNSVDPARFAWFDTMSLVATTYPDLPDKRQETIADHLGIDRSTLPGGRDHNALTDAHVAASILAQYLKEGPENVLANVKWPLVSSMPTPQIVTTATAETLREEESEYAALLAALNNGPEEKISIPRGSEIYFTQFYSETHVYSKELTRLGATEARNVTKSRCKLVVTGDREYVSGAMKKALKFSIPIVHFDYIGLVELDESS